MSNFQETCLLSCEKWVDSFPDDMPKHKFSKNHKKKIKEIFETDTKPSKCKILKRIVKMLLIAAILFCLAITAFAISESGENSVRENSYRFESNLLYSYNVKKIKLLELNYISKGFLKTEEYNSH